MGKEDIKKERQRIARAPKYVNADVCFLSITMTLFVLILTVKSELLSSKLITLQLVFAVSFWIATLMSQVKIVDHESLKRYYLFSKLSSGIALAFLYNTIGLLVARYVYLGIGLIFLSLYLIYVLYSDIILKRKITFRGVMILAILIFGGILPALGILFF